MGTMLKTTGGRTEETLRLADGRVLGYAQYGNLHGKPVFFFHGFGASRRVRNPNDALTASLGVRLITIDRPGIGLSTPQNGRTLLDWPGDVAALADALQIERFAVLGWSAGGPHALACAYSIPNRITATGIANSAPPFTGLAAKTYLPAKWHWIARMAKYTPWLMHFFFNQTARQFMRNPAKMMAASIDEMGPSDKQVMANPAVRTMMLESARDVFLQGGAGMSGDALALARPWGFRLEAITQPIHLWHGAADTVWNINTARYLAGALPDCRATFYPGEEHLMFITHWKEILQTLAE